MTSEEFQQFDLISLTPDTSQIWGQVLNHLRKQDDLALYIICSAHVAVDFSKSQIWLTCFDDASYRMLEKYKKVLEKIAGEETINIIRYRKDKFVNKKTQKLKQIFGDRLRVEGARC